MFVQVDSREEVGELLSMEGEIDLVIPRGGNELVKEIMEQAQGRIPVLGHAEGICHVYVDKHANMDKAIRVGKNLLQFILLFFSFLLLSQIFLSFLHISSFSFLQLLIPSVTIQQPVMPWKRCWCTQASSTPPPSTG